MVPILQRVQQLQKEWRYFLREPELRLLRLEINGAMRKAAQVLIRAEEYQPQNRRPYPMCEAPFQDPQQFADMVLKGLEHDMETLSKGLRDDGIALGRLPPVGTGVEGLWRYLDALILYLRPHFDGMVLVWLPLAFPDSNGWRAWIETTLFVLPPFYKLAAADSPDHILGPLVERRKADTTSASLTLEGEQLRELVAQMAMLGGPKAVVGPDGVVPPPSPPAGAAAAGGTAPGAATTGAASVNSSGNTNTPSAAASVGPWTPDFTSALRSRITLATAALADGRHTVAISHQKAALELVRGRNLPVQEATCLMGLGNTSLGQDRPRDALLWFKQALDLALGTGNRALCTQSRMACATACFRLDDFDTAAALYEAAAADAAADGVWSLTIDLYRMAGTCHHLRGQDAEALRCWRAGVEVSPMLPAEVRPLTTLPEVVEAFVKTARSMGLYSQAASVERLMQDGS